MRPLARIRIDMCRVSRNIRDVEPSRLQGSRRGRNAQVHGPRFRVRLVVLYVTIPRSSSGWVVCKTGFRLSIRIILAGLRGLADGTPVRRGLEADVARRTEARPAEVLGGRTSTGVTVNRAAAGQA